MNLTQFPEEPNDGLTPELLDEILAEMQPPKNLCPFDKWSTPYTEPTLPGPRYFRPKDYKEWNI